MIYKTSKTKFGNVGVSYISMDEAQAQADKMDEGRCSDCVNCTDCLGCVNCTDCLGCIDCTDCTDCKNCTDCLGCVSCKNCLGCVNCTDCLGCMDCEDCLDCENCKDCNHCLECIGVNSSQLVRRWNGGLTKNLVGLYGIRWNVATDGIRIQIGCKNYSAEEWEAFPDHKIKAMDYGALEFWRIYKDSILSLARLRRPHGTRTAPKRNDKGI